MTRPRTNILTLFLAVAGAVVAFLLTLEHFTKSEVGCFKTGEGCASTINSSYGHVGPVPTAILGLGMYVVLIALCLLRAKRLRLQRERETQRANAYATSALPTDAMPNTSSFASVGEGQQFHLPFDIEDDPQAAEENDLQTADGEPEAAVPAVSARGLDTAVWSISLLGFAISVWLQYVAIYQLQSFCKYCFTSACLISLIFALASRDYLLDGRKLNGEQKMIGAVLGFIAIMVSFIVIPQIIEVANHHKPPVYTPVTQPPVTREIVMSPTMHVKGDPSAKHTLIEFADYQCGHCAETAPYVDKALKQFPHDVKIAFRSFPLVQMHQWSRQAAQAAEAADMQGKFWQMHDVLFKHQQDMDSTAFEDSDFDKFAEQLKLNVKKFHADRLSSEVNARVEADIDAGNKARVDTTPTFFFVSPSKVTRFLGRGELEKFMADPASPAWK